MATQTEKAAQVLLPAMIGALAAWFLNLYEARSSPYNILLLLVAYLVGFATLRLVQREMHLPPTTGLFVFHVLISLVGGLLALALLQPVLRTTFSSFLLLPLLMFALPAVSEYVRFRNVRTE